MWNTTGLVTAIAVIVMAGGASAQPAPSPAVVLGNVQQFYANAHQLTAQFRQIVTNATFNTTKASDGKLWVAKPAQFRWDYLEKQRAGVTVAKTFAFDGATLWLVDHKTKQIFQSRAQNSTLPAAVSFLTGGANLATQFDAAIDTSGKFGGKNATVLELTPKQPSAQYKQLFFVVDPTDWHVSESIVIDSNGDTNELELYNPDLQSAVKAQWFAVNPPSLPTYKLVVVGNGAGSGSGSGSTVRPVSKP